MLAQTHVTIRYYVQFVEKLFSLLIIFITSVFLIVTLLTADLVLLTIFFLSALLCLFIK